MAKVIGQHAAGIDTSPQSIEMLRLVVDGDTYEKVARRFGKSRTAVERRIKAMATQLSKAVGIPGLNHDGATYVRRLRLHRDPILSALKSFNPAPSRMTAEARILSSEEIAQGVQRIKGRSSRPLHDVALFYLLFCIGAKPLEIARLEVRDYLDEDGEVRRESLLRPEVAITGKARTLYFASARLNDSLTLYLEERRARGLGVHAAESYRGLDPQSRLFLSEHGQGFHVKTNGANGQNRSLCRSILETYEKLFRYAEFTGVSARSARLTSISLLYDRGADEEQVGLIMGISERSAVRALLSRPKPNITMLVTDLI